MYYCRNLITILNKFMLKHLGKSFFLSSLLSLLSISGAFASDFYWVGNSGNWNNPSNWSITSGGSGGAGVPTQNDDAVFDGNSIKMVNTIVTINSNIALKSLIIKQNSPHFTIQSNPLNKITIYGVLDIKGSFSNEIKSTIYLKSNQNINHEMYFGWYKWKANFYFDGNGTYLFKKPLTVT